MSGVVVIGAAGGCGTTTFACALALARRRSGEQVLLVDLDPHGGGPSALWGVPLTRSLDDACALGSELDPDHLAHLIHRHATGIDVMAGAREPLALSGWSTQAVEVVSDYVASRPSWVVDAGRGDTALAQALLRAADRVVLLAPRTGHGVRRASHAARVMQGQATVVVATELPAGERVPQRALERAVGFEVVATAPRDDRAAAKVADAHPVRGRGLARAIDTVEGRP